MFAQVMGEERNGRVRMVGLGVTPTDLWRKVPSKNIPYRIFMEQQNLLEKMNQRFEEQEERYKKQDDRYEQLLSMLQDRQQNCSPINVRMPSSSASQARNSSSIPRPLVVMLFDL